MYDFERTGPPIRPEGNSSLVIYLDEIMRRVYRLTVNAGVAGPSTLFSLHNIYREIIDDLTRLTPVADALIKERAKRDELLRILRYLDET